MSEPDSIDALYTLVHKDPAEGLRRVDRLIATQPDNDRLAALRRIEGLAHVQLSDPLAALRALDAAVDHAEQGATDTVAGEAYMTRAGILGWLGRGDDAFADIDRSVARLTGIARARALVQRSALLLRKGDLDRALTDLDLALPTLRRRGDDLWLAKLYTNRGIALGFLGRLPDAERSMRRAVALYRGLGLDLAAASALQNLAWGAGLLGDLPTAFAYYDEAEAEYRALEVPFSSLWNDRAELLLAANLADEAAANAQRGVRGLMDEGMEADAAEAMLVQAEAELVAGRPVEAEATAAEAATWFERQRRDRWVVEARHLEMQARFAAGSMTEAEMADLTEIADTLGADGHSLAYLRARLLLGRAALSFGRLSEAERVLQTVAVARNHRQVRMRTQAWLAETLLRQARGDRVGALRSAGAGLRAVALARSLVGTADIGVSVAGHGVELGRIGLRLALEGGRPPTVLRWMELTRATALQFPPIRPIDDRELAAELAQFRAADRDLVRARREGEDTRAIRQRVAEIGTAVSRRRRRTPGVGEVRRRLPQLGEVRKVLGTGTLVEIAGHDGRYVALVVNRARRSVCPLGEVAEVATEIENLRFGMSRLAQRRGSPEARRAAAAAATASVETLAALLIDPLALEGGESQIVIVPPAELHVVPWGLVPGLRGRPVTVAPSSRLWLDRVDALRRRVTRVLIASGPDLPAAAAESRAVAGHYQNVTRLGLREAKVERVIEELGHVQLAHLVAHGDFRSDNPLFSSLSLADGPLTVYDLGRASRLPAVVVLSACNAGIPGVRPGNETMGIVAGLLGAGVRTVVASVGLVPDGNTTKRTMLEFHRRLAGGERPAAALAAAIARSVAAGPAGFAEAGFVCFGAG